MTPSRSHNYVSPGLFIESVGPDSNTALETAVPLFIGLLPLDDPAVCEEIAASGLYRLRTASPAGDGPFPVCISRAGAVEAFGGLDGSGFLTDAVRGFFENGGKRCRVGALAFDTSRTTALAALDRVLADAEILTDIDLVAAPDLMWLYEGLHLLSSADVIIMQNRILDHCRLFPGRFAVLDALPEVDAAGLLLQRKRLVGDNGALYHPFVKTLAESGLPSRTVPPCGHVCGIYARCDHQVGVHRAPANEALEGVVDLASVVDGDTQDRLNPLHVNVIRAFPGRGLRLWGGRTLSRRPEWRYVNVRRVFLTLSRWLDAYMAGLVFEPNDHRLWARVRRDISACLETYHRQGALAGAAPRDAFFVHCDERTNPADQRDLGRLVTEIGLAPASPCEFIVIRIIHTDGGTRIVPEGGEDLFPLGTGLTESASPFAGPVIAHIAYTAPGRDLDHEYVEIENRSDRVEDLGNWTLGDRAGHVYLFPRIILGPGARCRIWTRAGTDTDDQLFWGMGRAVWNNTGDRAVLRDRHGLTVHTYEYAP
ncbi:hypothetical protein JCM14469_15980 [Desulfatiferula olefinivorans]